MKRYNAINKAEETRRLEILSHNAFTDIKEVAKFYSDWVIKDPRDGSLIATPSSSPENSY